MFLASERLQGVEAVVARRRLQELEQERALAAMTPLGHEAAYMADLEDEIRTTRAAFVGAAVTELATLRGELGSRIYG